MEASLEVEDDVFFADLSKQIALLIMDDDNDTDTSPSSHGCCSSVSLQAFSHAYSPVAPPPVVYEANGARVSKGTGVFIPRSSLPRKKSRSGRFSSTNQSKYHKQHSHKSRTLSCSSLD